MVKKKKSSGMSLIEVLVAISLAFIMLVLIGELYSDSMKMYQRTDFTQLAQKFAGIIIETMAREIRGGCRIEEPTTNLIPFPIDTTFHDPRNSRGEALFNELTAQTAASRYVAFSKSPSPVQQRAYAFHYNPVDRAIYYYSNILALDLGVRFDQRANSALLHDPTGSLTGMPCLKRFGSDNRLTIEDVRFWAAPDGVVIRVVVTDTKYTHYYDYATNTLNVTADSSPANKYRYEMRPTVEQSVFVAIRYYN